jgi:predicted flap endonuclease-1-like 5' DNA nuclease
MCAWLPWLLLLLVLLVLAVLIWWWWTGRTVKTKPVPAAKVQAPSASLPKVETPAVSVPKVEAPVVSAPKTLPASEPKAVVPDNLEIIEGIGPVIARILNEAGIKTFVQLAATPVSKITDIVKAAGLRLFDATTWPEQAKLAAEGKMDELKKLQDSLKAGRRA